MIKQVRWWRVVIAAFLVEVGILAVALPFTLLLGERVFVTVVPAVCVIVPFVITWLATRKLPSGHGLHGWLIGIVATVMYFALVLGASSIAEAVTSYGSMAMLIVVNALRVVSAAAGGYFAGRRPAAAAG